MCGPAVRVLRSRTIYSAVISPVRNAAIRQPINSSPVKISHINSLPTGDIDTISLPLPTNITTQQYTKTEAIAILSATKKGSATRAKTMRKMISLGYAPTKERTLQRLMKSKANGDTMINDRWDFNLHQNLIHVKVSNRKD